MKRTIMQISSAQTDNLTHNSGCYVLCDDGSFWFFDNGNGWIQMLNIPQFKLIKKPRTRKSEGTVRAAKARWATRTPEERKEHMRKLYERKLAKKDFDTNA
jgi:hypothetical protein